jgi:hypothetical protein
MLGMAYLGLGEYDKAIEAFADFPAQRQIAQTKKLQSTSGTYDFELLARLELGLLC